MPQATPSLLRFLFTGIPGCRQMLSAQKYKMTTARPETELDGLPNQQYTIALVQQIAAQRAHSK
ncbi:MAG: hypothetical protein IT331_02595 [Anaerolineae bacterium]|nr:hypothetical protein [Anaerolineae bacterium]